MGMSEVVKEKEDRVLGYIKCRDAFGFTCVARLTENHPSEPRILTFDEAVRWVDNAKPIFISGTDPATDDIKNAVFVKLLKDRGNPFEIVE